MRIVITENQYTTLVEQVGVRCVPTGKTEFNKVSVSFYDMLRNGSILNYGDYDSDKTHPIYVIQKKLGINRDGYYGKDMLKALSINLDVDLCKQINNNIPLGPNALKKLGLYVNIPENNEDYILASTLVGENQKADKKELNAILSTIKNRADKCGYSMKDSVLKGKQYSTWNYYNRLNDEGKFEELHNRIINHGNIAHLWSWYLKKEVTAYDVAMLMSLLKIARTKTGNPNKDDIVDGAAYLAIAGEIRFDD